MKKILFPTDFSSNAGQALQYAIGLCESLKAELILFHACRADALAFQMQNEDLTEEAIIWESMQQLKSYREKNITRKYQMMVEEKVSYGLAVDAIITAAEETKADLIIMGTKGSSGIEEMLIGSNTTAVMENAKCPVIAIPANNEFHGIRQIAFATDFREKDFEAIIYLSSIAELFDAKLIMVHVADVLVPDSYEQALFNVFEDDIRSKVNYKNISFETIKGPYPAKKLNEFVTTNKIDFVAVSSRKNNLFKRLFQKSFTRQLAYHSTIPVMAFHG